MRAIQSPFSFSVDDRGLERVRTLIVLGELGSGIIFTRQSGLSPSRLTRNLTLRSICC